MLGEARILFPFPSQPALETAGCVALFDAPVAARRLGVLKNATHPTRDIKGTAFELVRWLRACIESIN
jgi:hypothetical protein